MQTVHNIFIKLYTTNTIKDNSIYKKLMNNIANQLNYTVLESVCHEFKPYGFTGVLLLSESHLSIHTWPEDQFVVFEMVTCKPFSEKEKRIILKTIKKLLQTTHMEVSINK